MRRSRSDYELYSQTNLQQNLIDMSTKQLPLFVTAKDFLTVVDEVNCHCKLEFVASGLFDQKEHDVLSNLNSLNPFCAYLYFEEGTAILERIVQQKKGGVKIAVDQILNPSTVVLNFGGLTENGQRLVSSQIGTATSCESSNQLFGLFSKIIRQKFEAIKSFYVGPEAAYLLEDGVVLAPSTKSP
jgi:hypothetical protein